MTEFYTYSTATRLFITFTIGILALFQTLSLSLNFYRYSLKKTKILETLLETCILIVVIIYALLHGQVVKGYEIGLVIYGGYEVIRFTIYIVIILLVGIIVRQERNLMTFDAIVLTILILPLAENLLGSFYPALLFASLILLIVRSLISSFKSIYLINNNISFLSVINAIDSLETAVLFSDDDGQILLINDKMQKLMHKITNRTYRNARQFYSDIIDKQQNIEFKKTKFEDQVVYFLPGNSAWMFSKVDIEFKFKNYIQISATNVSKLWELTDQLQKREKELLQKSVDLKATIANLHILSKEKELNKARIRAHNILGQRLSLLLRTIQNQEYLDYKVLTSLSINLLNELKSNNFESTPEEEITNTQNIFSTIGVDVKFNGDLPKEDKRSRLFVEIIKEGCTNAVRHGFAKEIMIEALRDNNTDILTISNRGVAAKDISSKGSGIKNIKDKVISLGGFVEIVMSPVFTLTVVIPGGDDNV